MSTKQLGIGLVSIDELGHWPGGRHLLHQIIRSVALLSNNERLPMHDVWWLQKNESDTSFDQVKDLLGDSVVIRPPERSLSRMWRKISRKIRGRRDFGDLFHDAGIGVLFPTSSCERPGIPLILLLPDLQHKRRPDLYSSPVLEWFEDKFDRKIAEADLIIVNSRDVLNDLHTYYPASASKARLLLCASLPQPEWFVFDPMIVAEKYRLKCNYFIVSNGFTEHKNHLTVFEAIGRLKKKEVDLQIACTGHSFDYKGKSHGARLNQYIEDHGLTENIKMLGFLPRAEQMALIRGAQAVLQPSLFEGWSNPIEEARSLGRPLILSDIPIHREKNEDITATLVGPTSPEEWAKALVAASEVPLRNSAEIEAKAMEDARLRAIETGRTFVAIAQEALVGAANPTPSAHSVR